MPARPQARPRANQVEEVLEVHEVVDINNLISDPTIGNNITEELKHVQFSREDSLPTYSFDRIRVAIVIGLGGIGSHVAEILSTMRIVDMIIMFDNDIVELTNLNRTAYRFEHVGASKVEAMSEIISSKNPSIVIKGVNDLFNEDSVNQIVSDLANIKCTNSMLSSILSADSIQVFDCRDDDYRDYNLLEPFTRRLNCSYKIWRPAYNGLSITIDGRPEIHPVWGNRGYTIIPSHSLPSRMAALLIVLYSCNRSHFNPNAIDMPYTFNVQDVMKYIMIGSFFDKLGNGPKADTDLQEKIIKRMADMANEYVVPQKDEEVEEAQPQPQPF